MIELMSVIAFNNDTELLRMANDSHYGLAAAIWTQDVGRELGPHGLADDLETKHVYLSHALSSRQAPVGASSEFARLSTEL